MQNPLRAYRPRGNPPEQTEIIGPTLAFRWFEKLVVYEAWAGVQQKRIDTVLQQQWIVSEGWWDIEGEWHQTGQREEWREVPTVAAA